ncbi:OLC1v1030325C1 [Oldenlandia corymbosa var. corymbosa]|uniref:OLC1v1030325C1 n=1 Tax=Oldenlandia corymbosa var. corymbosa TaxID=529605 RepID=A0AAV1CGL2_OLDCO|nr:OLC1v1030325C1 [Oldenlandia corymbosa var. corymbosa]
MDVGYTSLRGQLPCFPKNVVAATLWLLLQVFICSMGKEQKLGVQEITLCKMTSSAAFIMMKPIMLANGETHSCDLFFRKWLQVLVDWKLDVPPMSQPDLGIITLAYFDGEKRSSWAVLTFQEIKDDCVELPFELNHFFDGGFGSDSFDIEPGGTVNSCTGKTIGSMLFVNDDMNSSFEYVGVTCMNYEGNEDDCFAVLNDVSAETMSMVGKDRVKVTINPMAKFVFNHDGEMISSDCVVPWSDVSFGMLNCVEESVGMFSLFKDGVIHNVDIPVYLNEENDHMILDLTDIEVVTLELSDWSFESFSLNDPVNDDCMKSNYNSLTLDGISIVKGSFNVDKCWKFVDNSVFEKGSFQVDPGGVKCLVDVDCGKVAQKYDGSNIVADDWLSNGMFNSFEADFTLNDKLAIDLVVLKREDKVTF